MRIVFVAAVFAGFLGCGGRQTGLNQTTITCPAGRTLLDNVCVSEAVADYVACVRAQGAQLGGSRAEKLSAEAGGYGVHAGGAAQVSESLEKKYSASDQAVLEIVRACSRTTGMAESSALKAASTDCPGGGKRLGSKCVSSAELPSCACEPWTKTDFTVTRDGKTVCTKGADCATALGLTDGKCSSVGTDGKMTIPWCYTSSKCPAARAGQHPWVFCEGCPAGTRLIEDHCVPEEQAKLCECLFWADLDVTVKKDGGVLCSGKGGCASTLGVVGNQCAKVGTDGAPSGPWCYVSDGCPVAKAGQYRWINCEP